MENPNATWIDFSTRITQKNVSYQFSSNFLSDEKETEVQLASLQQEMKTFGSELKEQQVIALESTRKPDPNLKCRQNATRFCTFAAPTDILQAGVEKILSRGNQDRTEWDDV